MEKKRNYNIDFLRGFATICIILIHTTFWSGEAYLPKWFITLSMFIDVPAFMFISGITFNFSNSFIKNIKGLFEQWKKWLYFLLFYVTSLIIFFYKETNFADIFNWIFYSFPKETKLIVVQGSLWFIPMYIVVTSIASGVICILRKYITEEQLKKTLIYSSIALLILLFGTKPLKFGRKNVFYLIIFFIGYISYKKKINFKQFLFFETISTLICFSYFKLNSFSFNMIQDFKFDIKLGYALFATISIILFWYLKDNLKIKAKNPINFIGKNAIFFYYSQGISSSLLIHKFSYLPIQNIWLKFLAMYSINIAISLSLGVFLTITYNKINKLIKVIKKRNKEQELLYFPKT